MRAPEMRFQDLSKFRVPVGFRGRSGFVVILWQFVQATIFAGSPQPAYGWRRWLLRMFGASVGRGVLIRPSARVTFPWKVEFDDHCWVGDHAEIYSLGAVRIGKSAVVSQRSYICAGTHDYQEVSFPLVVRPVVIEAEAWIAADCFVAPGITIGRGAVVGARSTVLADVPPGAIVGGHPAVFKKMRVASLTTLGDERET